MQRSKSRPASRSTSPTLAVLGNAAATRTPTDSCANTSPRALTFRAGTLKRLTQLQPCSTADPARPLVGGHPPKHSMSTYSCSRKPVLRRSIEPSQFTSWAFTRRVVDAGLLPWMGSVGDCYDNAPMECFWSRVQIELFNRKRWKTRVELATALFEHLEIFHNHQRRHSSLGMMTPVEFELRRRPMTVA